MTNCTFSIFIPDLKLLQNIPSFNLFSGKICTLMNLYEMVYIIEYYFHRYIRKRHFSEWEYFDARHKLQDCIDC